MRITRTVLLAIAATGFLGAPAFAQGRGHVPPHPMAKAPSTTTTTAPTATTTTTSGTTTGTTGTTASATTNPIASKIASHPQLNSTLTPLLPKGMTLTQAAAGFRNQGQFIAALHVSHNLNIPFTDLKSTMLGTTARSTTTAATPMSLGQAIHALRPAANAQGEATRATAQAKSDLSTSPK